MAQGTITIDTSGSSASLTSYEMDYTGAQINTAMGTLLNTDFDTLVSRAEQAATAAGASAMAASNSDDNSEAWAVGEINGVAVGSADTRYHNNAKYYAELAASAERSAASVAIADAGGYFTGSTVEAALQEIGSEIAGINTLLGTGVFTV